MNKIESADELFDQFVDLIGTIVSSFNKNAFPGTTFNIINNLLQFLQTNKKILKVNNNVELRLLESLIDLDEELKKFISETNTSNTNLFNIAQRRDFVLARNIFKDILKKFYISLKTEEKGMSSSLIIWKKSANKLARFIGYE